MPLWVNIVQWLRHSINQIVNVHKQMNSIPHTFHYFGVNAMYEQLVQWCFHLMIFHNVLNSHFRSYDRVSVWIWRQTNERKIIEICSWFVTHRIIKLLQTNMIRSSKNMKTNAEHEETFFFSFFFYFQKQRKKLTTIINQSSIFVPFTNDRVHTKKAVHIWLEVQNNFVSSLSWAWLCVFWSLSPSTFRICFRCFRSLRSQISRTLLLLRVFFPSSSFLYYNLK